MPDRKQNIIQAEFFHTGHEDSLDEVMGECERRIQEDSRIKTVVRFYDTDGCISRHVQKARVTGDVLHTLHLCFQTASWLRRQALRMPLREKQKQNRELRESLVPFLQERLTAGIDAKEPMALERPDWSFRDAFPAEMHELRQSIAASKRAWVFVFAPAPLTSESSLLASFL